MLPNSLSIVITSDTWCVDASDLELKIIAAHIVYSPRPLTLQKVQQLFVNLVINRQPNMALTLS